MEGIRGKVVAITGASGGIGEATALRLGRLGAKVVVGARRADRLRELVGRIEADGGEADWIEVDVTRREDLVGLVEKAVARFGRLDVLVGNAGIGPISRIDALRFDDWDAMIDVNLRGVLHGFAGALPVFQAQGTGHFVNVVSTAGLKIVPQMGVYAATKNAVRTVSEALRQESGAGLRVTVVSPGFVKTDFADSMTDPAAKAATLERRDQIAISPDAVARAIAFAIEQPDDVEIGDLVIRPTAQD